VSSVVVSGFFVGLVYGLLTIGLVIVYRGARVINFAHGETGMVAAMVFADLRFGSGASPFQTSVTDRGVILPLLISVAIAAALGAATELLVARPLRAAPRVQVLVGTLAVGSLLYAFAADKWGTDARYNAPIVAGAGVRFGGIRVSPGQLLILVTVVIVLSGLGAMYRFTALGLRMRATALDPYAAGLVGVNVNANSMATWALAGALAGLSAILIAPLAALHIGFMVPLAVPALAATLVGGLTNLSGAFAAAVLIGVAQAVIAYKSPISGITDLVVACAVLAVLVVRPSGLFRSAY
jgi:branched-chain amino acid transport system permease protein